MTFTTFSDVVPEVGGGRPRRPTRSPPVWASGSEPSVGSVADIEQAAFERGVAEGRRQVESERDRKEAQLETQVAEAVAVTRLDCAKTDAQAIASAIVGKLASIEQRLAAMVLDLLEGLITSRLIEAEKAALIAAISRAVAVTPSAVVRICGPEQTIEPLAHALAAVGIQHETGPAATELKVAIDDTRISLSLGLLERTVREVLP